MTVLVETTRNVLVTDVSGTPTVVVTETTPAATVLVSGAGAQGPRGIPGPPGSIENLTPLEAQLALHIYVLGLNDSEAGLPVGAIIIRKSVP